MNSPALSTLSIVRNEMELTTLGGQDWTPLQTYFFHNKSRHTITIYSVTNYNVVTAILEDASLKTGSNPDPEN